MGKEELEPSKFKSKQGVINLDEGKLGSEMPDPFVEIGPDNNQKSKEKTGIFERLIKYFGIRETWQWIQNPSAYWRKTNDPLEQATNHNQNPPTKKTGILIRLQERIFGPKEDHTIRQQQAAAASHAQYNAQISKELTPEENAKREKEINEKALARQKKMEVIQEFLSQYNNQPARMHAQTQGPQEGTQLSK